MTPDASRPSRSGYTLVAIGIFKIAKSVLLLALGVALLHWRDEDLGQVAARWLNALWVTRPYFDRIVSKLSSIDERTLREAVAGSFIYSALLLIEGTGLCLQKRWAEYLTVGITASLLPFEFYELYHRVTATGVTITVINIAIMWYLIVRIAHDRRAGEHLSNT